MRRIKVGSEHNARRFPPYEKRGRERVWPERRVRSDSRHCRRRRMKHLDRTQSERRFRGSDELPFAASFLAPDRADCVDGGSLLRTLQHEPRTLRLAEVVCSPVRVDCADEARAMTVIEEPIEAAHVVVVRMSQDDQLRGYLKFVQELDGRDYEPFAPLLTKRVDDKPLARWDSDRDRLSEAWAEHNAVECIGAEHRR